MKVLTALIHGAAALLLLVTAAPFVAAEEPVQFNRDIRPILSDKCFACHGPDDQQRKGGLRLDQRNPALSPAKSGKRAIVPGAPSDSELVQRITTHDTDDLMPPPEGGKTLTPQQVQLLQRWIAQGAEYHEHWSFVAPVRPPIPQLPPAANPTAAAPAIASGSGSSSPEIRHPIDAFVLERLVQDGLSPAPEADRTTLIRRATLDLTGLPPSPDEVDAFLADTAPKAYERLVDRLLDSPRYGERMALDWLDAARYADTHGYHLDSGRDMTAWRDWVIRAFNENKPFDQFTVDQLAGDLLPEPTLDQRIATGFNRNHMINYEGGAIPEEYHYAYLVDRVNTTATVWLGLTTSCAHCHDHKYDPISRRDFYGLLAFFNNVPERGLDGNRGNAAPLLKLPSPDQQQRLETLDRDIREAEAFLKSPPDSITDAQRAWEISVASQPATTWIPVAPSHQGSAHGSRLDLSDDGTIVVSGPRPAQDTFSVTFPNPLPQLTALRVEALPDEALARRGPGRADNGNFHLTGVRLAVNHRTVPWRAASADFSQKGHPIEAVLDADPATGWAIDGAMGKPHAAILELGAPASDGPITLDLQFQGPFDSHTFGRFRISATASPTPHQPPLPSDILDAIALQPGDRPAEVQERLTQYYRERISPELQQRRQHFAELRRQRDQLDAAIPSTMVMAELPKPRETFMRIRGEYDKLGDPVTAATPAFLPPLPQGEPLNRLGLARWLVSPDHPLMARVTVNRFWQTYFGTGLVKTSEDFGSQGDWPSHPKLLDWLAREFIESGWNVKHLQRLIVTSATYRQASRVPRELYQQDPENRLLARGARFRLPAEFIRDQALAISGLLDLRIGGASVSPYQPAGLWEELSMREDSKNFSAQFFVQSRGQDLYRRSMYTFWKRSSPPPQMATFDAPDRETCTVRRPRTNTPLQSLILLNDPTYIEASRKLAERLLRRTGSDADRISWAFRLATARAPKPAEQSVLLRLLEEQRAHYAARRDAAEELLSHGDAPRDLTLDAAELAAWTLLSSTLLNLDETLTKG